MQTKAMMQKLLLAILFFLFNHYAKAQQDNKPIAAAVKMYNGRPVIMLNDTPQYPLIYSLTDVPGRKMELGRIT
jgi:hypothetical protein